MKSVAIKKGQIREKASGFNEMGLLRCDRCGEEFSIAHHPSRKDAKLADRQAVWLEKVLAEEHEPLALWRPAFKLVGQSHIDEGKYLSSSSA